MRFRLSVRRGTRQRLLPFLASSLRLERRFKWAIAAATALACGLLVGGTTVGRHAFGSAVDRTRLAANRVIGLEPDRAEVEAVHRAERARAVERTRRSLTDYYERADPAIQRLFRAASMDPNHCLIGTGRASDGFLLSSEVFGPDANGRSYRMLPSRRSVWLRQITLRGGPFGLFLVPDTPEVRAAAAEARAIVDETSAQTTNSWGLRGIEPDPKASVRGIVLGDSFMQGMFNGDRDTPPRALRRALTQLWGTPVSIVNTGHIGYAPEQYYYSLKEYGERFRPHFVIVSVCPNDFGKWGSVLAGEGDEWEEGAYWLGEIVAWCRSHTVPCLLVPVPCDPQILGVRRDGRYPAPVSNHFTGSGLYYCDPLDQFIDEHLRLRREAWCRGAPFSSCPLYNLHIADNHFSPIGAELWARIIARRLDLLVTLPGSAQGRPTKPGPRGGGAPSGTKAVLPTAATSAAMPRALGDGRARASISPASRADSGAALAA